MAQMIPSRAAAWMVGGWTAFLLTGSVQTIWPMFGIANQLLAVIALAVATTMIVRARGWRYAWVTAAPLAFVGTVTITAAIQGIRMIYLPLSRHPDPAKSLQGWVDTVFTALLLACVVTILAYAARAWRTEARR